MRYIHFNCLKQWIKEKMIRKEIEVPGSGRIYTYTWKQFECEICKQPYPLTFKSKNERQLTYGIVQEIIKTDIPKKIHNTYDESFLII
jgi:hypothetical protein